MAKLISGTIIYGNATVNSNLVVVGNIIVGAVGAISGAFHTVVGNITQTSSGGAVYINTAGNLLVGGNSYISGNTYIGGNLQVVGNIIVGGNIIPTGNISSNIGSVTAWFNTFFGYSTHALYADLAENYSSDAAYPPGTVVVFGGSNEVTISNASHDPRIAGIVSTDPAYLMNAKAEGVPVALQGRVPCQVLGPVAKGDRLVSSQHPGIAQRLNPSLYEPGCIIGKALQAIETTTISTIEVVVGRV